jgi:hypothetical protein
LAETDRVRAANNVAAVRVWMSLFFSFIILFISGADDASRSIGETGYPDLPKTTKT